MADLVQFLGYKPGQGLLLLVASIEFNLSPLILLKLVAFILGHLKDILLMLNFANLFLCYPNL